ncbi:MAG: hypothetical protein L0H53_07275 [Candidatus Nitrosocosmicus sp.]|nr:hypothetical protein [Candidatus Nitrosocosmicus sp.]
MLTSTIYRHIRKLFSSFITVEPRHQRKDSQKSFVITVVEISRNKSEWCNTRTSKKALSVLMEWIELNGKPTRVIHDSGREFTSNIFKKFLNTNRIKDKLIPRGYPLEQGKVEAYIQQDSHR